MVTTSGRMIDCCSGSDFVGCGDDEEQEHGHIFVCSILLF
jgi:hypothetical protein